MFAENIKDSTSLVTPPGATRTRFLKIALEKNKISSPFVEEAHAFRALVEHVKTSTDLVHLGDVRKFMLSAAGLSDKSLLYLSEDDKQVALDNLNEKFLIPAGPRFVDEAIYRYLLIKGDTVGGSVRNMIGKFGEWELVKSIMLVLDIQGINFEILKQADAKKTTEKWSSVDALTEGIEQDVKAMRWRNSAGERVFVLNASIPTVNKNVDLGLFSGWNSKIKQLVSCVESAIMMGELKGGIDPAGADEHWKTANSALTRIRTAYEGKQHPVKLGFVGAAIETNMAKEIFEQYQSGLLDKVANLTSDVQLAAFSNWLINL